MITYAQRISLRSFFSISVIMTEDFQPMALSEPITIERKDGNEFEIPANSTLPGTFEPPDIGENNVLVIGCDLNSRVVKPPQVLKLNSDGLTSEAFFLVLKEEVLFLAQGNTYPQKVQAKNGNVYLLRSSSLIIPIKAMPQTTFTLCNIDLSPQKSVEDKQSNDQILAEFTFCPPQSSTPNTSSLQG